MTSFLYLDGLNIMKSGGTQVDGWTGRLHCCEVMFPPFALIRVIRGFLPSFFLLNTG
jgi:hypothetical protein